MQSKRDSSTVGYLLHKRWSGKASVSRHVYRNLKEMKDGAMWELGRVQHRGNSKFKNRGWKQESQGPEESKRQSRR